jgi:hypothetical protein
LYAWGVEERTISVEDSFPNSTQELRKGTPRQPPFARRELSVSKTCKKQVVKAWQSDRQERKTFLIESSLECDYITLDTEPQSIARIAD